jgi:hypothetical protein
MNIIKHGEQAQAELMTENFKCDQCGCEFSADNDEYYVEKGSCFTTTSSLVYMYTATVTDTYVCSCPECHKIVTKTKERTIANPCCTVTGRDTVKYNPDISIDCSNHPSNGGKEAEE